jgi:hypothetical protein
MQSRVMISCGLLALGMLLADSLSGVSTAGDVPDWVLLSESPVPLEQGAADVSTVRLRDLDILCPPVDFRLNNRQSDVAVQVGAASGSSDARATLAVPEPRSLQVLTIAGLLAALTYLVALRRQRTTA